MGFTKEATFFKLRQMRVGQNQGIMFRHLGYSSVINGVSA
jgi:hypothetical protein